AFRSSLLSFPPASFLFRRLRDDVGNIDGLPVFIYGNVGEVGRTGVRYFTGLQILSFYPDPDLHGGCSSVVDRCFEAEKVSDIDGMIEVHAIDARRDNNGSRVAEGRHSGCNIYKFEYCPAVDVS